MGTRDLLGFSVRDARSRGFNRRDLGRMAALLSAGAALPFYNEATLAHAQDLRAIGNIPPDAVKLNANENPMGPCPAAIATVRDIAPQGGRYLFNQTFAFIDAMAAAEGVPASHVLPFAGSSDPLHRCVLAYTSPERPLVVADPGYEAPERAARFVGARVVKVSLRKDYSHDPAMARADRNAGMIYVCNPNNPTGSVTRRVDLATIVADKPEGCVVVVDEAYIHFSTSATPAIEFITAGKDVIVLRTFSKLYGMAGLRAGAAIGRPDLLEKLRNYGGLGIMPVTGMAAATASLKETSLVAERRQAVAAIRDDLCAWLDRKGFAYVPSEANMLLIEGRTPGRQTVEAMLRHKVAVGRSWLAMPNHVRVTIGTADEMVRFREAFDRVMQA
jgi:histidinol-phosphate aminotransferase